MTLNTLNGTVNFLAEIEILKRTFRQGWRELGVSMKEDNVAAHVGTTAQITFILANLEELKGEDVCRAVTGAVFHDNMETRIGDRDLLSKHYSETPKEKIEEVLEDQLDNLPNSMHSFIKDLVLEVEYGDSKVAQVVKDADRLDCAMYLSIVVAQGRAKVSDLDERLKSYREELNTESGKKLLDSVCRHKDELSNYLAREYFRKRNKSLEEGGDNEGGESL